MKILIFSYTKNSESFVYENFKLQKVLILFYWLCSFPSIFKVSKRPVVLPFPWKIHKDSFYQGYQWPSNNIFTLNLGKVTGFLINSLLVTKYFINSHSAENVEKCCNFPDLWTEIPLFTFLISLSWNLDVRTVKILTGLVRSSLFFFQKSFFQTPSAEKTGRFTVS